MYHMFKTRMAALKSRKIELNYFKEYTGEIPTNVRIAGRHFENQFQAPILFYILGLTILVSKVESTLLIIFLTGFVITRMLHSYIHLRTNHLIWRMRSYGAGWLFLIFGWLTLLIKVLLK